MTQINFVEKVEWVNGFFQWQKQIKTIFLGKSVILA